jgi:hypothetical protein
MNPMKQDVPLLYKATYHIIRHRRFPLKKVAYSSEGNASRLRVTFSVCPPVQIIWFMLATKLRIFPLKLSTYWAKINEVV